MNCLGNVPRVHFYGVEAGYRILIIDYLGPSISDLLSYCGDKFSVKTTCVLAVKMITTIEFCHAKGILHRDIKPGNFVMGRREKADEVFLIDFGLASPYLDENGHHVSYSTKARFHGTDKYAAINNHKKIEPCRKDDLESLGYLLVYFLRGNLPWSMRYSNIKRKHRRAVYGRVKEMITVDDLTWGLPYAFHHYFRYLNSLFFSDRPDYDYLRRLFHETLQLIGEKFDNQFDWKKTI